MVYYHIYFAKFNDLRNHKKIHIEKQLSCTKCDQKFNSYETLSKHKALHDRFSCSKCDKKFTKLNEMKKHKRTHTNDKPHDCPRCDKKLGSSGVKGCRKVKAGHNL